MNRHYPHPLIAREGWPFLVGIVVITALATYFFCWWSAPLWIIALVVLQFFRDPPRDIPQDPKAVLCPADGRIVVVGKAIDPYRNREALKISVFMNVFNVHSQRSPVDGIVEKVEYHGGSFLNAALDKASLENERCALHLKTKDGRDITCVQIAGLVARRILNYVDAGVTLAPGQRYGFIRFGSRVDLYLPLDTKVKVVIGEKVQATSTVLAELS